MLDTVVETPRLVMRPPTRDDLADSLTLWTDMRVLRHLSGKPNTREEVWQRLLRYAGMWHLLGFGFWIVRDRATGRFLGEIGFLDGCRDLSPPITDTEMGWSLVPEAQGQGLAGEAVRAGLSWYAGRFGHERIVCLIHPDNAPSLRLADRCGFEEYARTTYKDQPGVLLARIA